MDKAKEHIEILAQPTLEEDICQFIVDYPIYSDGTVVCRDKVTAWNSPLLEELIELTEIKEILLSGSTFTLAKKSNEPWQLLGKKIGSVIRSHIKSGKPLFPQINSDDQFKLENNTSLTEQVKDLLDKKINPSVASHGGRVSLVEIKEQTVYLELSGGCQGCGMAKATLKQGIERTILESIPVIKSVVDVTDHSSGQNPFYKIEKLMEV